MTILKTITCVTHDLTANWNKYPQFIPKAGEIICYDDRTVITHENGTVTNIPGFKVGDGNAYLIDLPFVGDAGVSDYDYSQVIKMVEDHEAKSDIHVTPEEKEFWNNKLNYQVDGETLIFTRN